MSRPCWALVVVAMHEGVEAHLLLQDVLRGWSGLLELDREMHPLMPPFCSGWRGAIRSRRMPQPPDGEFTQAVERMRRRERELPRDAVPVTSSRANTPRCLPGVMARGGRPAG